MCFAPLVGIAVNDVTHDVAEDMSWQYSTVQCYSPKFILYPNTYISTRVQLPIHQKYIYIMMDGGGDNDDG